MNKIRCCAPFCKNDSRNVTKSQDISFHLLPIEPTLRATWLQALGLPEYSDQLEGNHVCSTHFSPQDIFMTKNGYLRLRAKAVPVSNAICRVCLTTEGRLDSLETPKLKAAFEDLTGILIPKIDRLPRHICIECSARLMNCEVFKNKCLRSNSLMLGLSMKKNKSITIKDLDVIDRNKNRLKSNLQYQHYDPDHCDIHVIENSLYGDDIDTEKIKDEDEIKSEDEQMITDEEFLEEFNGDDVKYEIMDVDSFTDDNYNLNENFDENIAVDNKIVNDDDDDDHANNENYTFNDNVKVEDDNTVNDNVDDADTPDDNDEINDNHRINDDNKVNDVDADSDKEYRVDLDDASDECSSEVSATAKNKPHKVSKLFNVKMMTYEEQIADIEKRKETDNYKNSTFRCVMCYKGFKEEDTFTAHMLKHTQQHGHYICGICKIHFDKKRSLHVHIFSHHHTKYSCKKCSFVTNRRHATKLHEKWHSGTRYECKHCLEVFNKYTTYMNHVRIKHASDNVCALCGHSFVSAKGLDLHKKLKHQWDDHEIPGNGPVCEVCDVTFATEEAYQKHLQVSPKHMSHKDTDTDKPVRRRRTKAEAEKKKLEKIQGPIPCELCGEKMADGRAYHRHFTKEHPGKNRTLFPALQSPCMCEQCGRIFQSYHALKQHSIQHTGESISYTCTVCNKSFSSPQTLCMHRRSAHDGVPRVSHTCAVCGKSFNKLGNLQKHMFGHTGQRPHVCEICGKQYKHACDKRQHVRYVHNKEPWPRRNKKGREE